MKKNEQNLRDQCNSTDIRTMGQKDRGRESVSAEGGVGWVKG